MSFPVLNIAISTYSCRPEERTEEDLEVVEDLLYKIKFLEKIDEVKAMEMCKV